MVDELTISMKEVEFIRYLFECIADERLVMDEVRKLCMVLVLGPEVVHRVGRGQTARSLYHSHRLCVLLLFLAVRLTVLTSDFILNFQARRTFLHWGEKLVVGKVFLVCFVSLISLLFIITLKLKL